SGLDRFNSLVAMVLFAPGLFSTTNVLPIFSDSSDEIRRAMVSLEPPGAMPTVIRTGLLGYSSAMALNVMADIAARTAICISLANPFMNRSPVGYRHL